MFSSYTGHVMNLANSIIGVSLLAMPFCFKQCGVLLAIVLLILSCIMSKKACYYLVKASAICRRRNFEFLAFYTFGPSGKLLVELGVIGFMMGTCVAFFVVMGDLGPTIISKIFSINNSSTLRTIVLIGLGLVVILPLGLLRNVESLAAVSTVTIGFYFLFTIKIFFESVPHLFDGDWWYYVNFWQPKGVLQCIPIFAMALSCQTQLFEIYDSFPAPSFEKMNFIVSSALNLCTLVYASVGFLGYIAYCKGSFTGNILLSFTQSLTNELFKMGFVLSIAVSFPLVIFPCRASLHSLIFKRMPIHHELNQTSSHIPDSQFKSLTIAIVLISLTTGLSIPSIELVLGFVGSTIGIAICIVFPSLSFLSLSSKSNNEQVVAKIIICTGILIMVMGIFGNLYAAVEKRSAESISHKHYLPDLKESLRKEVDLESGKKTKKEVIEIKKNNLLFSKESGFRPLELGVKLIENRRKEPPIPEAPLPDSKNNPNIKYIEQSRVSIIEVKEKDSKSFTLNKPKKTSKNFGMSVNEIINKDAIEKEEKEIKEIELQEKIEVDKKKQELLKILKDNQIEQKKLLQEQEKILLEISNRENENKVDQLLGKSLKKASKKLKAFDDEIFKKSSKKENQNDNFKYEKINFSNLKNQDFKSFMNNAIIDNENVGIKISKSNSLVKPFSSEVIKNDSKILKNTSIVPLILKKDILKNLNSSNFDLNKKSFSNEVLESKHKALEKKNDNIFRIKRYVIENSKNRKKNTLKVVKENYDKKKSVRMVSDFQTVKNGFSTSEIQKAVKKNYNHLNNINSLIALKI